MSTTTAAAPALATDPPPRVLDEPGVRFGIGHAALVLAVLAAGALRLHPDLTLAVLVAATALAGVGLRPGWTSALGLSAWALDTGFVEHADGTLTFTGHDLARLTLLGTTGLLTGLLGRQPAGGPR